MCSYQLHKVTFTTAHFHVTTAQFVINCTLKYALVHTNFLSIFTCFRDIAAFVLRNATFSLPHLVSPKFPHVPLGCLSLALL